MAIMPESHQLKTFGADLYADVSIFNNVAIVYHFVHFSILACLSVFDGVGVLELSFDVD